MATSSANQAAASEARHDSEREVGIVRSRYVASRTELTNQIPYDLTYLLTQGDDIVSLRKRSRHKNGNSIK